MIPSKELRKIARARLRDAEVLLSSKRYDGAVYLCGYAVEMALKVRVCRSLGWRDFPDTAREFEGLATFRTHDLERLLHLSGSERKIVGSPSLKARWSVVQQWRPEKRYASIGTAKRVDAKDMIASARTIMSAL